MANSNRFPAYGGHGPTSICVGLTLGSIATILILLRIYVRVNINKLGTTALLWALFAWTLTVVTQVFGVLASLHGLGNYLTILAQYDEIHDFLKFTWLTVFFFVLAIAAGKVAVSVFLLEVVGKALPRIRWTLIAIAVLNVVCAVPVAIYVWFQCGHPATLLNPLQQKQCDRHPMIALTYFIGALAALSDLLLAIIPSYILWSLQIHRKLKWGLSLIMGTGVFAAAAAIVRTWASRFLDVEDVSYYTGILFIWGEIEEWLLIICMSVPPTWPLFKPYFQRFLEATPRVASYLRRREPATFSGDLRSELRTHNIDIANAAKSNMALKTEGKKQGWIELEEARDGLL